MLYHLQRWSVRVVTFYTHMHSRPYTIMLSIATMGLPLAVSKMVSKYDQLNDYHTVKRVLKKWNRVYVYNGESFRVLRYIC